jgi:hypothetical protein
VCIGAEYPDIADGARYRVDEPGPGLLAARNRDVWRAAQDVLFPQR